MLISSSFLAATVWDTSQVTPPASIAPQTAADPSRIQNHPNQPQQPASVQPHDNTAAHTSRPRKAADQKDTARTPSQPQAQPHREHSRRAARKAASEAQRTDSQAQQNDQSTTPVQDAQPSQFMAILGDILPPDAPATVNSPNANTPGGQDTPQGFQAPSALPSPGPSPLASAQQLPGAAESADAATAANQASGLVSPALARTSNVQANKALLTPAAGPEELAGASDPRIAIKKEAIPAARTALHTKPAESGELAFAARIAAQPGAKATVNFHDASSAIAASRFETAGGKGFSSARDHSGSNAGAAAESVPSDASGNADSLPPSQVLADSQLAAGTAARQTANPQAASASAGVAIAGARVAAEAASPQSGLPVMAASSSTATSDARGASGAKAAAEGQAQEFLEPAQDQPTRNGESVKDISLRLSDKDQNSVQVRLSERGGELRVSVRTPDTGLTRGLRDGLTDLVGRLEHTGYRAETWQPADGSTSQDQGRQPQDQSSGQQQSGSQSGSGQQQNARDHQQPDAQTPQWVGELESSLQRSDNQWPASLAQ